MRQYAVIANLDGSGVNRYTMSSLPLHVTILSIFYSEEAPSFFGEIANDIAKASDAINVETIGRALYGVDEDIPVTLVRKTPALANLHHRLLDRVSGNVTFRTPQFTGDNFGPHVTDQSERYLPEGTDLVLDNLTLVEIEDQDVIVRSVHDLRIAT